MNQKKLQPDMDLNLYFDGQEEYQLLNLGLLTLPTGAVIAADPLFSLPHGGTAPFHSKVAPGQYPVTLSVLSSPEYGDRYLAACLGISKRPAVEYRLALKGKEKAAELGADEIYGFPVEAGLGAFCDARTQKEFESFAAGWYKKNPDGNLYDDYFAAEFAASYRKKPKFQRKDGDWINWKVPGTDHNIIMFNSGFGDGVYPCYWGYDREGEISCLVIQFISPAEFE